MKINIVINDKYEGPEPTGEIGSFDFYKGEVWRLKRLDLPKPEENEGEKEGTT